jgi:hypothetical protein
MGLCASSLSPEDHAEKGADKKVDQAMKSHQMADQRINKLLLLGQSGERRAAAEDQRIQRQQRLRWQ